jgi:hypothetical protein
MFIVEQARKPVLENGATSAIDKTYAIRRLETGFFSESRDCNASSRKKNPVSDHPCVSLKNIKIHESRVQLNRESSQTETYSPKP